MCGCTSNEQAEMVCSYSLWNYQCTICLEILFTLNVGERYRFHIVSDERCRLKIGKELLHRGLYGNMLRMSPTRPQGA